MSSFRWQFYWKNWYKLYPSLERKIETIDFYTEMVEYEQIYFFFGPLQCSWYRNVRGRWKVLQGPND